MMKTRLKVYAILGLLFLFAASLPCSAQQADPWKKDQLLEPSVLAAQLNMPKDSELVIIDVGPAGVIKNARETGPVHEKEGMKHLRALLRDIPRSREVVIYCGCCPFAKCPNIRPAFRTLVDMGFTKPRLLDLSHNLKADWIDKGYPMEEEGQ
jgi:hypothetical protein